LKQIIINLNHSF